MVFLLIYKPNTQTTEETEDVSLERGGMYFYLHEKTLCLAENMVHGSGNLRFCCQVRGWKKELLSPILFSQWGVSGLTYPVFSPLCYKLFHSRVRGKTCKHIFQAIPAKKLRQTTANGSLEINILFKLKKQNTTTKNPEIFNGNATAVLAEVNCYFTFHH